jgi:integrase
MASIEKRTRNGRTTYRVRYRDPAGRQRSKVFTRKADADGWLTDNDYAKRHSGWVDPAAGKVRLGEWAERWYGTTAALRPTTRRDYRKLLDLEILPTFAAAPIASIDTLAVREWLAAMAARGLGPKRAGKARAVLSQLLDAAVEGGKLSRNVAAGVKPPKVQRAEMCFLDAGQVEALAEAIDPRYATVIRFGAYSGLRPSELTALKVGRLDLLRGTVRVVEAATEVDGRLHWGGVKTHEARTVRLPRSITDELAARLSGRPHGPEDLVFPAPLGGPMRWSKWTKRYFKPAALAAGLPERLRLYDLRHTCASLLIREGATVKAVQAQLGHATASITLDTYGHLFPDELDQLAGRLEAARAEALEARRAGGPPRAWPQSGPTVVPFSKGAGQ